jgi:hypothetical protein
MSFNYEESYQLKKAMEPARAYLWRVVLPDIRESSGRISGSPSMIWANNNARPNNLYVNMKELNTRVTEVSTPYFTIETRKNISGASYWYSPTHNDIASISMTMMEDQSGSTFRYIDAWKNMMMNSNGTYNPPAFFKKEIYMYRLNLMKKDFQVFKYVGYFPNEVAEVSNSYEENSLLKYQISFTGDSMSHTHIQEADFDRYFGSTDGYSRLQKKLMDVELNAPRVLDNLVDDALSGIGINLLRKII